MLNLYYCLAVSRAATVATAWILILLVSILNMTSISIGDCVVLVSCFPLSLDIKYNIRSHHKGDIQSLHSFLSFQHLKLLLV